MFIKRRIRLIAVISLLVLDIILTAAALNAGQMNQPVFTVLHFIVLAALCGMIIQAEKDRRSSPETELPAYWKAYLAQKIPGIRKKDMEIGDHGDSFIFITDLHYDANDGYSAGAAEYILDHTSISKVVIGGDICNGSSGGKQVCIDQIMNCRNAFRKINPYYLRGNHDNNTEISERTDEKTISDSELYSMILKPIEDRITRGRGLRYTFQNEPERIRYICLDTGHPDWYVMDDEQIAWMQDRIRELAPGWTAVVLTHQFYDTDLSKDGNGEKILAGLNEIYDEVQATIACVICGHSHADYMEISAKGFPVICTTCDARGGECGKLKRTYHTPMEQAFDVIHIDTAERKVYATRIGAGSDRQASY